MLDTQILGILNVTPDSFADGGRFVEPRSALQHAQTLRTEGADWVDVGAESTRPGAAPVDVAAELARLEPIYAGLKEQAQPWSADTQKPEVMAAALAAGAGMINDVNALQAPGALEVAASSTALVVLMHRQGSAATMQAAPRYDDVVADVVQFLEDRKSACVQAGIAEERIIVDPGIGFGKTLVHNLALLRAVEVLRRVLAAPLMIGVSRKSMFAALLGLAEPDDRVVASVTTGLWCAAHRVDYLRVHDVAQTKIALQAWSALESDGED